MYLKLLISLSILGLLSSCATSVDEKHDSTQKEVIEEQRTINSLDNFKKYYNQDVIFDEKHNLKACMQEFVYGCDTDTDCSLKASTNCSQYLPQECYFGTFGVECDQLPPHCSINENLGTVECPEFKGV